MLSAINYSSLTRRSESLAPCRDVYIFLRCAASSDQMELLKLCKSEQLQ